MGRVWRGRAIPTTNHCFTSGRTLYTKNGTTSVGIPYRYNANYDAELIDTGKYNGAGANSDEGEQDEPNGIKYYPLPAFNQVLDIGEQVCQDGISSYLIRNAVPCNQTFQGTTSTDVQGRNGPPEWVTELYTVSSNGAPVVIDGDSGAVAFVVASATTRDIVGMVSQGYSCNTNKECTGMGTVGWGNGLLDAFGFTGHLNPHT